MDIVALISGGKDSALALHRALRRGFNVKYLVTLFPRRDDSWMFHYPNVHLTHLFAEAAEIPLVTAETSGIKEEELEDLKNVLSNLDVEGIVSGAVLSNYQKSRVDAICRELGFTSIAPLWRENQVGLLREIIDQNFHVIITGVYAHGFDQRWLGSPFDEDMLADLIELREKYGISVIGEGGEYESLVLDAPYFKKRIEISEAKILWNGDSGHLQVQRAELKPKSHPS